MLTDVRVAAYFRQSQDRDGNEYGIGRQRDDVLRMCAARGWTITDEYVDNDVSATSRRPRPQFNEMMKAVDAGEYDIIVARHMDRLLRRVSELEHVLERCTASDTYICTASDGVDTSTDGGRLVARILASVGQGEMERKSARQRSAYRQAADAGRWVGGRRPFGYESDGVTVREPEAVAIRQGYQDIIAGVSAGEVARRWTAAGLRTPQSEHTGAAGGWTNTGVRYVLTNPRNAGLRRYRGDYTRLQQRQDPTLGIVGRAEWPAIVSEDVWRAACSILTDPGRRRAGRIPLRLLTGIARCAVCGETLHGSAGHAGRPGYRCRSRRHVSRASGPVDDYVEAVVVARLSQPDAVAVFAPQVKQDVTPLATEAQAVRERLDGVAAQFADGVLTDAQLRTITTRLRDRLAELESEMAEIGRANTVAPLASAADAAAVWETLDMSRKRAIISALMEVTVHSPGQGVREFRPETVEIEWKV